MNEHKILIVDDTPENIELLSALLDRNGWDYDSVDHAMAAVERLKSTTYDLVITDLMMPQMNGIELLEKIKQEWPETEVIIVTAYGSIPTAIEAIKKGAYTYLLRPFEPEEVALTISKVFEVLSIRSENTMLKEELNRVLGADTMIGQSHAMQSVYRLIDTVAETNATILILGESGSGKELIARAIHNKSPRAGQPFIKVACAALPEALLESELFGHEKGAFTHAVATRKGRFELADKGTLFLDEIGEISLAVQVKLLRAIQEREFERVGGTKTIKTDTRIISATNKNLAQEVERGAFRDDLYYRLNVISVEPPPLRERKDDIPQLVYHFLKKYQTEMNKDISGVTDEALAMMTAYPWPGNVRELQNVIERAVVLCPGAAIESSDLPEVVRASEGGLHIPPPEYSESGVLQPIRAARARWEKRYIERALEKFEGNITRTAVAIKIARKNLQEKIKTYQITPQKKTAKTED